MNNKKKIPTLKEFAKRAKCDDYMAAAFYNAVFKSRKISIDEFLDNK